MNGFRQWLTRAWQTDNPLLWPLIPFSVIFEGLVALRKKLYQSNVFFSYQARIPIIVVGNITVGGTGKTPLVIYTARLLKRLGYRPAIITRGYGADIDEPRMVMAESHPRTVGDEAVMMVQAAGCPVVACPNRAEAVKWLETAHREIDIIICDDGLQHYRLRRDVEICVIDAERRFGNNRLLPAGPLREPPERLEHVDILVSNGKSHHLRELTMQLRPVCFRNVRNPGITRPLDAFTNVEIHAVAGIGHPPRFFRTLGTLGIPAVTHPFADHHAYKRSDLQFDDERPIVMTAKDAVKCQKLVGDNVWYLEVEAELDRFFEQKLMNRLECRPRYGQKVA